MPSGATSSAGRAVALASPFTGFRFTGSSVLIALWLPASILALWWVGCDRGWISPQVLPRPQEVVVRSVSLLANGELLHNLVISLTRVLVGFSLGASVGVVLGFAMALSPVARQYIHPTFTVLACVPLLGWVPLLMIFLGIGEPLKYALMMNAVIVPVTLNVYTGVKYVPAQFLELARLYKLTSRQVFRHVIVPAAFPRIWSGARLGLTKAWQLLVVIEMLASSEGVGYMVISGQQTFQLDLVLISVIAIGLTGFLIDRGLDAFETRLMRWRPAHDIA